MLTEGIRDGNQVLLRQQTHQASVDLLYLSVDEYSKQETWFILHRRPDDSQTVTNASKLTVQETHSAFQAIENQCLCSQKTMDTAALYSI